MRQEFRQLHSGKKKPEQNKCLEETIFTLNAVSHEQTIIGGIRAVQLTASQYSYSLSLTG